MEPTPAQEVETTATETAVETTEQSAPAAEETTEEVAQDQAESTEVQDQGELPEIPLPAQQMKQYPEDLVAQYAQRFGWNAEQIAQDKSKAYAVKKAIDSDIFAAQLQSKLEALQPKQEEQAEQEPTPLEPTEQLKQYQQGINQFVQQNVSKEVVKGYMDRLSKTEDSVEQGYVLTEMATDLFLTVLPTWFAQHGQTVIENFYPSLGEIHQKQFYGSAWDGIREKDAAFQSLPAFNSPEFKDLMTQAEAKIPGFKTMQFTDEKGKPLPKHQNDIRRYELMANFIAGKKDAKDVVAAAEKGKEQAKAAERSRALSQGLGAGKSTGSLKPQKGDESPMKKGYALWKSRDSNSF